MGSIYNKLLYHFLGTHGDDPALVERFYAPLVLTVSPFVLCKNWLLHTTLKDGPLLVLRRSSTAEHLTVLILLQWNTKCIIVTGFLNVGHNSNKWKSISGYCSSLSGISLNWIPFSAVSFLKIPASLECYSMKPQHNIQHLCIINPTPSPYSCLVTSQIINSKSCRGRQYVLPALLLLFSFTSPLLCRLSNHCPAWCNISVSDKWCNTSVNSCWLLLWAMLWGRAKLQGAETDSRGADDLLPRETFSGNEALLPGI